MVQHLKKDRFDEYSSSTMPDIDLPGTPVEETDSGKPVVDNQGRFASKQDFVKALQSIA